MNADGLRRIVDPRLWPLAARVVGATVLLSGLAVFTVGAYLGSVISDGLFEQRQAQVLDESATIRQDLNTELRGTVDSTSTQTQEVAATFVQDLRTTDATGRRDAALVPVDSSSPISTIASDRTVLDLVDSEFEDSVSGDPYALSYRSVARTADGGREVPGLLVGTRVVVPGAGSFDLYLVYSLQEEQETLDFVQKALLSGGAVLLALVLGIAVMVARLVTRRPPQGTWGAGWRWRGPMSSRRSAARSTTWPATSSRSSTTSPSSPGSNSVSWPTSPTSCAPR
jgi:two-component system sensor histidine kinase MtrB